MKSVMKLFLILATVLFFAGCGGGGGGQGSSGAGTPSGTDAVPGTNGSSGTEPIAVLGASEEKRVVSGVASNFNFDFDLASAANASPGEGIGGGGDGVGGIGVGGALGQFLNADVFAFYPDGTLVGSAKTDSVFGMVTVNPGKSYTGALIIEIRGNDQARYFEEGKGVYVPFPSGQVVRALVPKVLRNIGVTPFSEAAYQLAAACVVQAVPGVCDQPVGGTAAKSPIGTTLPPVEIITKANTHIASILNQQFPGTLQVDDVARLPFIVGASTQDASVPADSPRGKYGLVNIAFSKQAAMYNTSNTSPTLLAIAQLAGDLSDGALDGQKGAAPATDPDKRTYDPSTLTTELSSALAQQTTRYGSSGAIALLPKIVGYGSARYDSYFFEARVTPNGTASTVAVATQAATPTRTPGQPTNYVQASPTQRGFMVFGNMGSGSLFIKTDTPDSTSQILAIGDNTNGELGNGNREPTSKVTPSYTLTFPGVVTHMAGGFGHTLSRLADGSVYAWGDNAYGQLGQGTVGGSVPRLLVPTKVILPVGATAVAAGNAASFALLADGRVFSWGSNWGFGTLGSGSKTTARATPAAVQTASGDLTEVVQLAAADNDAVAVRRDGTVWTWGSFPATTNDTDFVPVSNAGGKQFATQLAGLPATVKVRKVLTNQGLYAALMSDGSVYTWGVYFDISAGKVLADVAPVRVLNLPPVRDLMPGAFQAYGKRPTDRDTALAADYDGQYFRIRGRVAELYDPANPLAQRRPQSQAPRTDCASCHTVHPKKPDPMPTSGSVCANPPAVILQLLTSDSNCQNCHNGQPLSNRAALPILNCVKPALPARAENFKATPITDVCSLPATGHTGMALGTNCATCHNSVIASPLLCQATAATFAAPPSINATIAKVEALGVVIPSGGATKSQLLDLSGTLSSALSAGQTVQVLRNSAVVGTASVSGTNWTIRDAGPLVSGQYSYTSRVVAAGNAAFGPMSLSVIINVDLVSPNQVLSIASVTDNVPSGPTGITQTATSSGFTTDDTTPTLAGTLSAALGSGETVQILRNGGVVGAATVNGLAWTYTDNLSSNATYAYQVRAIDAAGNTGKESATFNVNLLAGPTAVANIAVVFGSGTAAPVLNISFSRALLTAERLVLTRKSSSNTVSTLTVPTIPSGALSVSVSDSLPSQDTFTYTAKIVNDAGNEQLPASTANVSCPPTSCITLARTTTLAIDVDSPSIASSVTGTIYDTTPTLRGTVSTGSYANLKVVLIRDGVERDVTINPTTGTWSLTEATLPEGSYTYSARVQDSSNNRGAASAPNTVKITIIPTPAFASTLADNAGYVTGSFSTGNPTDDLTPTLTVTLDKALSTGQTIVLKNSAGAVIPATVSPSIFGFTTYSLTPSTYLAASQSTSRVFQQLPRNLSNPKGVSAGTPTLYTLFSFVAVVTDGTQSKQSAATSVSLLPQCSTTLQTGHNASSVYGSECANCHDGKSYSIGPGYTCWIDKPWIREPLDSFRD